MCRLCSKKHHTCFQWIMFIICFFPVGSTWWQRITYTSSAFKYLDETVMEFVRFSNTNQQISKFNSTIISIFGLMYINIRGVLNVYFGTSGASQGLTHFSLSLSLSPLFHLLLSLKGMRGVHVIVQSQPDFTCWFCWTQNHLLLTIHPLQ